MDAPNKKQQGFTLIELMVVVMIVAILAVIGYPSYKAIIIKNAESTAKAQMGQLELQLDRWRTSALSYRGFTPMKGTTSTGGAPIFGYDNQANTEIYVPFGSNATNHSYVITLLDGGSNTSLLSSPTSGVNAEVGRSWVMVARPNPNGVASRAKVFVQKSTGMKCATPSYSGGAKDATQIKDCNGANWETW